MTEHGGRHTRKLAEEKSTREPTPAQVSLANLNSHLKALKALEAAANAYTQEAGIIRRSARKELYTKTRIALGNAYTAITTGDSLHQQSEEEQRINNVLTPLLPQLRADKEACLANAHTMSKAQQLGILYNAAIKLPKLSEEERSTLLHEMGYAKEQALDIAKKIGKSLAAGTIATIIGYTFVGSAAALGVIESFASNLPQQELFVILGLSYIAHYMSLLAAALKHAELLHDKDMGTSPNVLATSLYYLVHGIAPEKKKLQDAFIIFGTMITVAIYEFGIVPTLGTPIGDFATIGRNLSSAVFNGSLVLADALWHRHETRKRRR